MKNLMIAAVCLAALAAPRPTAAYPDSGAAYSVDAGGMTLPLLRDNKDPLLWYYLPSALTVAAGSGKLPELALIKTQLPAGADKLEDAAVLLAGLNLALPPDVSQKAAAAVAALPVMAGKAEARSIKFKCVDIRDARLTVLDGNGAVLAEAAPDPSVLPLLDPQRLAYTAAARGQAALRLGELALGAEGLKLRVDYSYAAGPGPVFKDASAAGSAGFGGYTAADRDKSVLLLPPGRPETVFVKLPQAAQDAGIASIKYSLMLMSRDGKTAAPPAASVIWENGGWKDQKGNRVTMVPFPVKYFFDKGVKREDILLKTFAEISQRAGAQLKTEKSESQAPLLDGDLPLALPSLPLRPLTISGDHLDFRGQDGLYAVQVAAKCGTEPENFMFKTNKEGSLRPEPVSVFFKGECKSLTLTVGFINGGGKKNQTTLSPGTDERLVYLQDPE